jgi:type IV secretion system protein TrbL
MGVCELPVISGVCDSAGEAAASLVTAPFDWLAESLGRTAAWMFESVWQVFATTTFVDITSGQFQRVYNILFGVAVFIMVGFFLLQVIGGMIRREPAALTRAVLGLGKSILGSFVALSLLAVALEVTDRLCVGIVHAAGTNLEEMGERMALLAVGLGTVAIPAPGVAAMITIFLSVLAIGAALIVWLSLLIRKALLLVAIVFAPIALSGSSWDHTRSWAGRWAGFVIALIVSKVVLVVIFLLATAQVSAPIDADLKSISEPVAGVVLMLVAGFAPYMTYKAINFIGFDMYHSMSAEQEAKAAVNRPVPLRAGQNGSQPRKVLDSGSPDSGGGSGGAGKGSPTPAGGGGVAGTSGGPSASPGAGAPGGGAGAAAGAGGAAAGVVAANEAGSAAMRFGRRIGGEATGQANAAEQVGRSVPPPSAPVSRPADSTPPPPAQSGSRRPVRQPAGPRGT